MIAVPANRENTAVINIMNLNLTFSYISVPARLKVCNVENLNPSQNPLCYHDRLKCFKSETMAIKRLTIICNYFGGRSTNCS